MTPATALLNKHNIKYNLHKYIHDTQNLSYGIEASEKLNVSSNLICKTLVTKTNTNELIVAILPVSSMLSLKLLAKEVGVKKMIMADVIEVENSTGYILGGVSPIGQKKRLKTFIENTTMNHKTIYISGGRRGLEIELAPYDLAKVTNAKFANICL